MVASPRKKREATSVAKKLEVLEHWEACGDIKVTMEHFYSSLRGKAYESKRVQIYAWRDGQEKLVAASRNPGGSNKKKNRPKGVRTALPIAVEEKIVKWVNIVRGEGVPISNQLFRWYALEVAAEAGIERFVASWTWQKRFLKRHRLSMRARTRQGQIRPEDADARAAVFAQEVRDNMRELGVSVVHNADQTGTVFLSFVITW
jgi:hypothetical protein